MNRSVRPVGAPRRLRPQRPRGGLVDPIALGIGCGQACKAGSRPWVEPDADRRREHSGAKCADDTDIRAAKALAERFELAQQHSAGAGVCSFPATHALDLPPGAPGVDL